MTERKEESVETLSLFPVARQNVSRGDLWTHNGSYLLYGDSTSKDDVLRLREAVGEPYAAVVSDPPYGEIQAKWDVATFGFIPFLTQTCKREATCLFFCSLPFGFDLQREMMVAGWQFRFDLVWTKGNAGILKSKFMPLTAHELLFAYIQKDVPVTSLSFRGWEAGEMKEKWGDRWNGKTVSYGSYSSTYVSSRQGREDGRRWIRSVLHGRKKQELPEEERTDHPSQKPLELVEKLVLLLSNEREVVYDPFVGSGTTLAACVKQSRCCAAIEQDPTYCADILERWQKLTGEPPVLLSSASPSA